MLVAICCTAPTSAMSNPAVEVHESSRSLVGSVASSVAKLEAELAKNREASRVQPGRSTSATDGHGHEWSECAVRESCSPALMEVHSYKTSSGGQRLQASLQGKTPGRSLLQRGHLDVEGGREESQDGEGGKEEVPDSQESS